jgi:hypothetical protein
MFFLKINSEHKELLAVIRSWDNLKIASDSPYIWVKDFTANQLESKELHQIPYAIIYELKENLLFQKGSLLPSLKLPSELLWTPILRALPLELPSFNHNFFGINEQVDLQILPSEAEQEAFVLVTTFEEAEKYITTAPEIRLQQLQWIIINSKVVLFGTPLLPIQGETYWKNNNFLLPSGFDFEFPVLSNLIHQKINTKPDEWVFWRKDATYFTISKQDLKPLTISSFRLTFSE